MNPLAGFSPPGRAVVVAAAIAIVVLFVQSAASIISPMLLALFIAVVATPALRWMRRKGVPKWGALAIIVFLLLDAGSLLALIAAGTLEEFRDSLPGYHQRLGLLNEQFGVWLESIGITNASEAVPDLLNPNAVGPLVRSTLSNMSGMFGIGLMVLLAVAFMLLEAPGLRTKLRAAFNLDSSAEQRLQKVANAVNQYMVIKSLASLATALCIWLWLWILGIDFAVLWAIIAFLLNFVPFVGAILMTIPAVLLALVQTDLQTTALVALGYVTVNTVIGSILEPKIMGRGLGISTLAVFLSLLFWGWILGTLGVFLAVPLTIALMIALDASPHTRPFAILLGPELPSSTMPQSAGPSGDKSQQA